jgi:hypothetical protein
MHRVALLGLFAMGFVLNATSNQANGYSEGPWCARFSGGNDYIENCSMRSFAMCLREIRGTGGNALCSPNPRAWPQAPDQPRFSTARGPKP